MSHSTSGARQHGRYTLYWMIECTFTYIVMTAVISPDKQFHGSQMPFYARSNMDTHCMIIKWIYFGQLLSIFWVYSIKYPL